MAPTIPLIGTGRKYDPLVPAPFVGALGPDRHQAARRTFEDKKMFIPGIAGGPVHAFRGVNDPVRRGPPYFSLERQGHRKPTIQVRFPGSPLLIDRMKIAPDRLEQMVQFPVAKSVATVPPTLLDCFP